MNIGIRSIKVNAQLWMLLGPFLVACILFIVSIRSVSSPPELLLIALGGTIACYYLEWKGALVSFLFLIAAMAYYFSGTADDLLWTSVLSLAIASAFVVTVLSLDESRHAWNSILKENQDQREAMTLANERLQALQSKYHSETHELAAVIEKCKTEIEDRNQRLQSAERLVDLVRDELRVTHEYQQKLLQELYDARQEVSKYEFDIEKKASDENMRNEAAAEMEKLKDQLGIHERENKDLKLSFEEEIRKHIQMKQQFEKQFSELGELCRQLQTEKLQFTKNQESYLAQTSFMQELKDNVERLSREKQLLEVTLSRLQEELETRSHREEESLRQLNSYRTSEQALHALNEKHQQDITEEQSKNQQIQEFFKAREASFNEQIDDLSKKLLEVSQQLKDAEDQVIEHASLVCEIESIREQREKERIEKSALQQECDELRVHIHQFDEQHDLLQQQQNEMEQKLSAALSRENLLSSELQKTVEQANCPTVSQADSREVRRLQGLYIQLRVQFSEKSTVLDATRKELFHTQEKLLALKKDLDEANIYGNSELEKNLIDLLHLTDQDLETREEQHRKEVDDLHQLIKALLVSS